MTATPIAKFTLSIPGRYKPDNYFWRRTVNEPYLDSSFLVLLLTMSSMWPKHPLHVAYLFLAGLVISSLFIYRDWRIRSGDWVHRIDDVGIWRQPAGGKGVQDRTQIFSFSLAYLHGIQFDQSAGTPILRLSYTHRTSDVALSVDIPYLAEDQDLLDTQLVPFLEARLSSDNPTERIQENSRAQQDEDISPLWRITLKSPCSKRSYIWHRDTAFQVFTLALATATCYRDFISNPNRWYDSLVLVSVCLLDAYYPWATWRCSTGQWLHYIDDTGISIAPECGYAVQKKRLVVAYKLHTIIRIEDRASDASNVIRCHYTNGHTFAPNGLLDIQFTPKRTCS